MANRSGADRAGRDYLMQRQAGWEATGREDRGEEALGGPAEVGSRGSAWERMLEALTAEDEREGPDEGSLRASIAERLNTRGGSPTNGGQRDAPDVRPVRRRRR
jgi:hypothetical protein